jgi:hypothetical protein
MNSAFAFGFLGAFSCTILLAQSSDPVVIDRAAHSRTWQTVREIQTPRGVILRTNSFEEIQTGLHRKTENGWVVCDPKIELFQNGAVVRGLQYSVIFAPNLASRGAIDLLLPDGQRLTGQITGLAYVDGDNSIMITETKDCAAVVGGPDQSELTYQNAFTDFDIDVKYVVRRGSFGQELLFKQALAGPQAYGLSDMAVLVLMTEWTDLPPAQKDSRAVRVGGEGGQVLQDEQISLGSMSFAQGRAFMADAQNAGSIPVYTRLQVIEGRTFLLEQVPWKQIQPEMEKLPALRADARPKDNKDAPLHAKNQPAVPAARQPRPMLKAIQMAQSGPGPQGVEASTTHPPYFVADYDLVTTIGSLTWKCDTTYYVSGNVTVTTNVFECGCVIKMAPTNSATLNLSGPITCLSTNARPIILTARDDRSAGETIGTNASPTGYYADTALQLSNSSQTNDLHHLRISYAKYAIKTGYGTGLYRISHLQIVHCQYALAPVGMTVLLRNALFYDVSNAFYTVYYNGTVRAEHLTVDQAVSGRSKSPA